jgi:hypothetical protein
MPYTNTDLAEVEDAIRRLQRGERVASVAYDGKTVSYTPVQLGELTRLRDRMRAEVQQVMGNRTRQIRLSTTKGLA